MAIKYKCPKCKAEVYDPTITDITQNIKCILCGKIIKLTEANLPKKK